MLLWGLGIINIGVSAGVDNFWGGWKLAGRRVGGLMKTTTGILDVVQNDASFQNDGSLSRMTALSGLVGPGRVGGGGRAGGWRVYVSAVGQVRRWGCSAACPYGDLRA